MAIRIEWDEFEIALLIEACEEVLRKGKPKMGGSHMESLFEQLGGTYTRQGDYCLPDVCLPPEEERSIGIYG